MGSRGHSSLVTHGPEEGRWVAHTPLRAGAHMSSGVGTSIPRRPEYRQQFSGRRKIPLILNKNLSYLLLLK